MHHSDTTAQLDDITFLAGVTSGEDIYAYSQGVQLFGEFPDVHIHSTALALSWSRQGTGVETD
jgi:hypothetical protein